MRFVALILALCSCRNVLGIPEEGVLSFSIGGEVEGVRGASDAPITLTLGDQQLEITDDGTFAFPDGLVDQATYDVRATPGCTVTRGSGVVLAASVANISILCDGLLTLGTFGLSAPLETTPAITSPQITYTTHGSILTQSSQVVPLGAYSMATTVALQTNVTIAAFGFVDFSEQLVVRVSNSRFSPLAPPREYATNFDLAGPIQQFGYGKPLETTLGQRFGIAIAGDDKTLVVAAPDDQGGKAFVFVRAGRKWTQETILTRSSSTRFGAAVALQDNTIVVGDPTGGQGNGAAYVFERDPNGVWREKPFVLIGSASSEFGAALAIGDGNVAIGAPGVSGGSGAVYIHSLSNGAPIPSSPLLARNGLEMDRFGAALAMTETTSSGLVLVVGAPGESSSNPDPAIHDTVFPNAGAAYVYTGTAFAFVRGLKASSPGAGDEFGGAVAITDLPQRVIAVGARFEDGSCDGMNNNAVARSGAVYVFSTALTVPTTIKAANCKTGDAFGTAVAVVGRVLVVGAPFENSATRGVASSVTGSNEDAPDAGAAYVFDISQPATPVFASYLKASNAETNDNFGASLALAKEALVISAPFDDTEVAGWNNAQTGGAPDADYGALYTFR